MNMYGRIEGAPLRQRTTFNLEMPPPPATRAVDLSYVRASTLAQVRLQLAVLSGNRRGALRELDRLVELDRQLEAIGRDGPGGLQSIGLQAQLDEQREAIASEKLALMAAVEFPRLAPAERSVDEPSPAADDEIAVIEDTEFAPKLLRILAWVLGVIAVGTALAFAAPLLATL